VSDDRRCVLDCRKLSVSYGGVLALQDVDLTVQQGEIVALLGPSGSGKSTLLHAIAGFLPPAAGEVWLTGSCVASLDSVAPPERRDVGVVFQSYALWPHLSVRNTVAYPLRRRGTSRREARAQSQALLARLHIDHLADRLPAQLSGGEQQRVGLARALARDAALYLLDEPTAHLDTHLRAAFQEEMLIRQRVSGAAAVYATHDAAEALSVADRVVLLDGGRIVQIGTPTQVYAEPVSLWAARLTGPASLLEATVAAASEGTVNVDVGNTSVTVAGGGVPPTEPDLRPLLLRPDWTHIGGGLTGRVAAALFRGPHTDYLLDAPGGQVLVRSAGPPRHCVGDELRWGISRAWVLPSGA
jgi:ABC-type Fe3+/spermidine/putrescine transport system ATPase subunit